MRNNTNKQPGKWITWLSFLIFGATPPLLFPVPRTAYWQRSYLDVRSCKCGCVVSLSLTHRSGANSYTHKQADFDQFMEVVRQFGLYWLMPNEMASVQQEQSK